MPTFENRLAKMLAAGSTRAATRSVKVDAAAPRTYLATVGSMDRTRFQGMMGLAARIADHTLAICSNGGLCLPTRKGPIELALPLALFAIAFRVDGRRR